VFCTSQNPNNYPRYPHDRLSVVKHRQLPRQIGGISADLHLRAQRTSTIWSSRRDQPSSLDHGSMRQTTKDFSSRIKKTRETSLFRQDWRKNSPKGSHVSQCLNQFRFCRWSNSTQTLGWDPPRKPIWFLFMTNWVLFRWDSGTQLRSIKRSTQAYFGILP
jgi:hypothetical protein